MDWIECWQCAGEGQTFDCFDGFCIEAEYGCSLCTRNCDVCEGHGGWDSDDEEDYA